MPASVSAATTTMTWKPSRNGRGSSSLICRTREALVNAASSTGVIKGGQVRALAVMSEQRVPEYADVPTLVELGYVNGKGLWSALYAPAATPRDVLETVRKAAAQALESEPVQTAFKKQMIKAVPNSSMDDAQAFNRAEMAYWKKVTDQVKVELPDN
jgi:tripartite-type tricarboxylate transporter receptor subunit TctC